MPDTISADDVSQNQQSIEQSKGDRPTDEQVHRREAVSMDMQECPSTLGRRASFLLSM
jgi:hypothetical protein